MHKNLNCGIGMHKMKRKRSIRIISSKTTSDIESNTYSQKRIGQRNKLKQKSFLKAKVLSHKRHKLFETNGNCHY